MAKKARNDGFHRDEDGFIHLTPTPGGKFERFSQDFMGLKIPKSSEEFLYDLVDTYGVDEVLDMTEVDIGQYVYSKGITHALNMNIGRNIPWIEDGLKSAERRVLYIMWTMGLAKDKQEKVATIVGRMIEKVYPHGDAAPAETIYRLGRSRSTMIPYIKPGGSFGNMYDLKAAAPRYASASLTQYAMDCFFSEIGVRSPLYDTKPNYNFSDVEPVFLTSRYPNVLMQWNQGIGNGVSTWMGAFNSKDIFKVALQMLDDPNCKVDIYPDLPTNTPIVNKAELKGCFDKKSFKVRMRAPYEVVLDKKLDNNNRVVDKYTIVFTSLPLSTYGKMIKDQIIKIKQEDQKKTKKRLPEVINVEPVVDEESSGGIKIIVEYERGYDPHVLAEKLYRSTSLDKTVGVQYTMVTDNQTLPFTPRRIMKLWITQRYDQKRRFYHQKALQAAKDRARYEGLWKVLGGDIDKAIAIIRSSKNDAESVPRLCKEFDLTEFQGKIIVGIRLGSLQQMDIQDTKRKMEEAEDTYKKYRKLLTDVANIKEAIRTELEEGLAKYGKNRVAPLTNLVGEDEVTDVDTKRLLVYNDQNYFCLKDGSEIPEIINRIDSSYQTLQINGNEMLILVNDRGEFRTVNASIFGLNKIGIGFANFFKGGVVRILHSEAPKKYDHLAVVSKQGLGKVMEYKELDKSEKGRVAILNDGDTLADIIPIRYDDPDNDILGIFNDDKMYYVKVSALSKLKRSATGNRVIKGSKDITLGKMVFFDMDKTDLMLLYGESGYLKVVDTIYLTFNARKPNVINLGGKAIAGGLGLSNAKENKFTLLDDRGVKGISIQLDGKGIKFTTDTGESQKFKIATSIGNPTKVFRKNKKDFYEIQ